MAEHDTNHNGSTNPDFAGKPRPRLEDYADYVEHPRFGKAPRFTGLDPDPDAPEVHLHYNTGYRTEEQQRHRECIREELRRRVESMFPDLERAAAGGASLRPDVVPVLVPGTAVEADVSRQTYAPGSVSHYYDLDRICIDCKRKFLFFAEEQKHWYEELGFPLYSDAVRCTDCRKHRQNMAQTRKRFTERRKRFEQFLALPSTSVEETLEMVEDCLTLVEAEEFSIRQCERVRMLLKRIPEERRSEERFKGLTARLYAVEQRSRGKQDIVPNSDPVIVPGNSGSNEEPSA